MEAIEQLQKADSPDKVRAEIERLLPPLGVEHYAFGDLSELKSEFTRTVPVIRARGDFIETSEKEALHKDDASLLHAKGVLRPFDYVKAPTKSQRSREVLNIVRDFGLAEGVVIPVPGIVRPAGAVWMVGHADLWRLMPVLKAVSFAAFDRLMQCSPHKRQRSILSDREKEILMWTAEGKSAWEIGEILNLSHRTIEWHIAQAMKKFGTSNRTRAVVLAIREGLIEPS